MTATAIASPERHCSTPFIHALRPVANHNRTVDRPINLNC